jgi:sugar fermentation stimulation protein A
MLVEVDGRIEYCHCPSTGRIGSIAFEGIPCLISEHEGKNRKTACTVEAFSLDPPDKKKKGWIGINQVQANRYVEYFLRNGRLVGIFGRVDQVKKEVRIGHSRIDFLVNGRDYMEVKTPLEGIPCDGHPKYRNDIPPASHFERALRHLKDASSLISGGSRVVYLICQLYDARPFSVPVPGTKSPHIVSAFKEAVADGIESWQANLGIDPEGVRLLKCFKVDPL